MMTLEIVPLSAQDLPGAEDGILDVYRTAFASPPYDRQEIDVVQFAGGFEWHAQRPGFRCFVAREGDTILGFTYGYSGAPGSWWYDRVARALGPGLARPWMTSAFEFVELAVAPAAQGRGIGGRLHDALLAGLPQRTALLSTAQEETTAQRLYRRRGWIALHEHFTFPGGRLPMMIMGLELARRRPPPR
ncbi:MAG TPA: GNAT family N-acetyltransferase [Chloroflexia bacterium]|nr:GNAT family N-acetyltransferase [Chloroflexia bacterium]